MLKTASFGAVPDLQDRIDPAARCDGGGYGREQFEASMRTIPPSSARYATRATDARYDVNETALRDVGFIVGACDRALAASLVPRA